MSRRAAVERWADELLRAIPDGPAVRVTVAAGGLACMVQVWPTSSPMPTANRVRRRAGARAQCRSDVLAVVRAAGRPLTRKELVRELRGAGVSHGPGTIAKALADLTASGELTNPRDKRGYRLSEWTQQHPNLFTELPL